MSRQTAFSKRLELNSGLPRDSIRGPKRHFAWIPSNLASIQGSNGPNTVDFMGKTGEDRAKTRRKPSISSQTSSQRPSLSRNPKPVTSSKDSARDDVDLSTNPPGAVAFEVSTHRSSRLSDGVRSSFSIVYTRITTYCIYNNTTCHIINVEPILLEAAPSTALRSTGRLAASASRVHTSRPAAPQVPMALVLKNP